MQSLEERVNAQLAALAQGSTQTLSVSLDDLRNVERQLAKLTAELTATRAELAETAQKAAESQDAAVAMEAELRRFKEEKEKEKASLKQQIAEAERSKLVASLNSTSSVAEASKEAELRETLAARETSLAMAQREMEELRRSLEVQREAASTMEANYRQEFQKHSNDLREWREKEKSLQALRTELSTAREVLAKKQGELDAQTAGDGERLKVGVWRVSDVQTAQTEAAELRQKLETLRQQNDSLFKQVAEVGVWRPGHAAVSWRADERRDERVGASGDAPPPVRDQQGGADTGGIAAGLRGEGEGGGGGSTRGCGEEGGRGDGAAGEVPGGGRRIFADGARGGVASASASVRGLQQHSASAGGEAGGRPDEDGGVGGGAGEAGRRGAWEAGGAGEGGEWLARGEERGCERRHGGEGEGG